MQDYAYNHPAIQKPILTAGNCHRDKPYWIPGPKALLAQSHPQRRAKQ